MVVAAATPTLPAPSPAAWRGAWERGDGEGREKGRDSGRERGRRGIVRETRRRRESTVT